LPSEIELSALLMFLHKNPNTLIVASSDFCHFGTDFQFTPRIGSLSAQEGVDHLNTLAIDAMRQSPELFYQVIEQTGNTVCGLYSISLGLMLVRNLK
jgi:AmmeMemoRadiSam system protein B